MMMPSSGVELALLSATLLGFRHGFDYDHIAAIADISSVQSSPRRAMQLGLLYALGHAATVAVLGSAVILFQLSLPRSLDRIAERLVGLTLVVLGVYVLGLLFKGDYRPRSRFVLLVNAAKWLHGQWLQGKMKRYWHSHELPEAKTRNGNYSGKSVFVIGVIHGLGAETPSQLLIFLLAANLGGVAKGFLGLSMFLAGLVAMNTLMTATAAGLFGSGARMPKFQFTLTALTAAYSLAVGTIFLLGSPAMWPSLR